MGKEKHKTGLLTSVRKKKKSLSVDDEKEKNPSQNRK